MQFLDHTDRMLFLFLNGFHNSFFDGIMFWGTRSLIWLPLYLFFLYLVIRRYKWKTLVILLFAALMILASDQLANLVKDSVQRLRPSQQPGLAVHTVEGYKGGEFGFYSSHASNTFSVVVFLVLLLGRKGYIIIPVLFWSLFMSYTRIYLGVHYPGDILCGWIVGGVIGFLFWKGTEKVLVTIKKTE
jgi:undecaprenyl-diphosphatase